MKIGIFGTGAYGMALSSMIDKNCEITMWTKFEEEKSLLEKTRKNEKLLPNFSLDKRIKLTTSVKELIEDKDLLIIAIPAAFIESLAIDMKPYIKDNNILIASKGIEQESGLFLNEIIKKHLDTKNIGAISGPTFAVDLISEYPCGLSLAVESKHMEELIIDVFKNDTIKLRINNDVLGTEMCGAVKNVMAIAAGILGGLGANESTKAMFITEALYDIRKILNIIGADDRTILTYAGIGDLLLTCTSTKSRNYTFGKLLGENNTKEKADEYLKNTTVEGVYTLKSIYKSFNDKNISLPTINIIYDIVFNGKDSKELLSFLIDKE